MSISDQYKKIYDVEIAKLVGGIIFSYNPLNDRYEFKPFSHSCGEDCIEKLGEIMRKNLAFYCYGEEEVVHHFDQGLLSDLEAASRYSYNNRIPKRPEEKDGLLGEVLLDLLIQIFEPDSYKMAVRPLLRQNDNIEIKGYDLAYLTRKNDSTTLWLGQAKLGDKNYCFRSIHSDLLLKFKNEYLADQVYFVAEKQAELTTEAKQVTNLINKVNFVTSYDDALKRTKELLLLFKKNNVSINIPCLLAYAQEDIYSDPATIYQKIETAVTETREYYLKHTYDF